jgi:LysR family transcriptional regulator, transcriptional activator of the cysJI operon
MHLETLKTFCDLCESGSLSRAARLNRVTQSAVSQQLRVLEQRFGRRLVERAPRVAARPTEAGQLLYQESKLLLERFSALEARLRERPDVVTGSVRVATVYSVGLHTLPATIKTFLAAFPRVNVRLEYRRTDQVYEACLAGEIDLGIVALPRARPQLEVLALRGDELVLALAPDDPLARGRRPALSALQGRAFIAFDPDIPTRRLIDATLRRSGVTVRPVMELDNIETIKRSVEAGLGLSLLPRPALANEVRAGTLVARVPREGPIPRSIGAIRRRGRELGPAGRAFLDLLAAELGVSSGTSRG